MRLPEDSDLKGYIEPSGLLWPEIVRVRIQWKFGCAGGNIAWIVRDVRDLETAPNACQRVSKHAQITFDETVPKPSKSRLQLLSVCFYVPGGHCMSKLTTCKFAQPQMRTYQYSCTRKLSEKNAWATNGPRLSHQRFYRFFGPPAI